MKGNNEIQDIEYTEGTFKWKLLKVLIIDILIVIMVLSIFSS